MVKDHSDSERKPAAATYATRVLLYALSHGQDSTYHGLCYTSRGTLTGTRNSSMGPQWVAYSSEYNLSYDFDVVWEREGI